MSKETARASYTITIRASVDDVNLNELIEYFNEIGRTAANQKIEKLILMGLLAKAKKHSGKYSAEQLRVFCLENCDNLSNYASFLRQEFGVIDTRIYSNETPRQDLARVELNGVNNGVVRAGAGNAASREAVTSKQANQELSPKSQVVEDERVIEDDESEDVDFDEAFGDNS